LYIPSVGGATAIRLFFADVWVVVFVTELEAQVVDDVASTIADVGALGQVTLSSQAADVLEADVGIGVGGGGQAREDALLGQEQGARADGEEGAPVKHVCQYWWTAKCK